MRVHEVSMMFICYEHVVWDLNNLTVLCNHAYGNASD